MRGTLGRTSDHIKATLGEVFSSLRGVAHGLPYMGGYAQPMSTDIEPSVERNESQSLQSFELFQFRRSLWLYYGLLTLGGDAASHLASPRALSEKLPLATQPDPDRASRHRELLAAAYHRHGCYRRPRCRGSHLQLHIPSAQAFNYIRGNMLLGASCSPRAGSKRASGRVGAACDVPHTRGLVCFTWGADLPHVGCWCASPGGG